jgi:hypothetical protein
VLEALLAIGGVALCVALDENSLVLEALLAIGGVALCVALDENSLGLEALLAIGGVALCVALDENSLVLEALLATGGVALCVALDENSLVLEALLATGGVALCVALDDIAFVGMGCVSVSVSVNGIEAEVIGSVTVVCGITIIAWTASPSAPTITPPSKLLFEPFFLTFPCCFPIARTPLN